MEWKYRKDFEIIPGIKLTYGKNGISAQIIDHQSSKTDLQLIKEKLEHQLYKSYDEKDEIKSASTSKLTSESLKDFKSLILSANQLFYNTQEVILAKSKVYDTDVDKLARLDKSLFKFLFKKKRQVLREENERLREELNELQQQLDLTNIQLDIDSEDIYADLFNHLNIAFQLLITSERKWDFTSSRTTNRAVERTTATSTITRSPIDISERKLAILQSAEPALCFHNINGGDIYFYPGFLIIYENKAQFALVSYTDLNVEFIDQHFIETEQVPKDSQTVGETWYKTNKDGSPDRRFASNYKIPIALYGGIKLTSLTGLNEVYCFSNIEYAKLFYKALFEYIDSLKKAGALINAFK